MKVLVTMNVFRGHEDMFSNCRDCEFVFRYDNSYTIDDIKDMDVLIGQIGLDDFDKAEKVKFVHWGMAGSDTVAKKIDGRGIVLTNSTGCFSVSIAENVIGMIMYLNKNFYRYVRQQTKHQYIRGGATTSILESKSLIVGFGSIGNEIGERLYKLGSEVTGIKRTPGEKKDYLKNLYTMDKLDDCLKDADIVILCMPQSPETIHVMNKERLAMLKDGAILINVGRGSAIDTPALVEELRSGRILAGLDVYEKEPLDENDPLWNLDNCLVLPHVTGFDYMPYTRRLLRQYAVENLEAYLNDGKLRNIVDYSTGYKISNS